MRRVGMSLLGASVGGVVAWTAYQAKDLSEKQKGPLVVRMTEVAWSKFVSCPDWYTSSNHTKTVASLAQHSYTFLNQQGMGGNLAIQMQKMPGTPVVHNGAFAGPVQDLRNVSARNAILEGRYLRCKLSPVADILVTGDLLDCRQAKVSYFRDLIIFAKRDGLPKDCQLPFANMPIVDEEGKQVGTLSELPPGRPHLNICRSFVNGHEKFGLVISRKHWPCKAWDKVCNSKG